SAAARRRRSAGWRSPRSSSRSCERSMSEQQIDRSDPAARAALALRNFERRQRAGRIIAALILIALALGGPFAAGPLTGSPGATFGAIVAAVLFAGSAVLIWPWSW